MVSESVKRIRGYAKKVKRSTNSSLKKHKDAAVKWNIQQMEVGKKADGEMQPGYSPATEGWNPGGGREPVRVTPINAGEPIKLLDTGKFHQGMYRGTKVEDNKLMLESADEKNSMLERDYDPFGLTKPNLDKLTTKIFEDLVDDLRAYFK